jgi:hypothetical protein
MTTPRRRIIRPTRNGPAADPQRQRQLQRLRERLAHERVALARWQKRLRRAFTAVERSHKALARLERRVAQLETYP